MLAKDTYLSPPILSLIHPKIGPPDIDPNPYITIIIDESLSYSLSG